VALDTPELPTADAAIGLELDMHPIQVSAVLAMRQIYLITSTRNARCVATTWSLHVRATVASRHGGSGQAPPSIGFLDSSATIPD